MLSTATHTPGAGGRTKCGVKISNRLSIAYPPTCMKCLAVEEADDRRMRLKYETQQLQEEERIRFELAQQSTGQRIGRREGHE